jgi:hypothetical protein
MSATLATFDLHHSLSNRFLPAPEAFSPSHPPYFDQSSGTSVAVLLIRTPAGFITRELKPFLPALQLLFVVSMILRFLAYEAPCSAVRPTNTPDVVAHH